MRISHIAARAESAIKKLKLKRRLVGKVGIERALQVNCSII